MTLNEFFEILRKNLIFIIVLAVVGALVAYFATGFIKSGYLNQQLLFLTIESKNPQDQLRGLDPSTTTDTAVALMNNSPQTSGSSTDAKKVASQVIRLTTESKNGQNSELVGQMATEKFNDEIKTYVPNYNLKLIQINQTTAPSRRLLNTNVLAVFGAAVGFLTALMLILIGNYFKIL